MTYTTLVVFLVGMLLGYYTGRSDAENHQEGQ